MTKTSTALCVKELDTFKVGSLYPIEKEIEYGGIVKLTYVHLINDDKDEIPIQYDIFKDFFVYHKNILQPTINENKRIALDLAFKNKSFNQVFKMETLFKEADAILQYLTT